MFYLVLLQLKIETPKKSELDFLNEEQRIKILNPSFRTCFLIFLYNCSIYFPEHFFGLVSQVHNKISLIRKKIYFFLLKSILNLVMYRKMTRRTYILKFVWFKFQMFKFKLMFMLSSNSNEA
jgi:hypothetical protein